MVKPYFAEKNYLFAMHGFYVLKLRKFYLFIFAGGGILFLVMAVHSDFMPEFQNFQFSYSQ